MKIQRRQRYPILIYMLGFSWNHIFECCFDQVCCRVWGSGASGSEDSILAMI